MSLIPNAHVPVTDKTNFTLTHEWYRYFYDSYKLQQAGGGGGGAVDSVNGQTGVVVLTAADVGAPSTNGTGASGNWPINISGSILSDAGEVGILNSAGTAWRMQVDSGNNLHVPGSISAVADVNGANFQGSGPYLILNGAANAEIGGLVALNAPGFGTTTQLYGRHVGGNWVGLQLDTPQMAGFTFHAGGFLSPGNITAFSDARLKTDWKAPVAGFVQRLAGIKAGTYLRTDSQIGLRQAGVVAQDVQTLLPEAVTNMCDNAFGEGDHTLGLNYGGFSAVAVVMLAREVVALRARLEALEGVV